MYEKVGHYDGDLEALVDAGAKGLRPSPTFPFRYNTTDTKETTAIYEPLLRDVFPGRWIKCFLSILWPQGGSIMPHVDADATGRNRCHLILQTNADSFCMHDGTWQQLELGGIYRMDPAKVHASINWGEAPRINFVIDRLGESQ